ncbi:hypothetical protein COU59_02805 [Candidatus Pacearchaeota archaeon CG10_big_fil_rev_8_21_14_0_10_34_12]|nr:MAG: hypothetical protein COU59_02805 [Candidatus Pacearchaeota archaeon CG10_big_fil_rev_8_21_14_0_10_34_12]
MSEEDYDRLPNKIRVVKDLKTGQIRNVFYDSEPKSDEPARMLRIKPSILEVFAEGSDEVEIKIEGEEGYFGCMNYRKVKDKGVYGLTTDEEVILRHISYERIK